MTAPRPDDTTLGAAAGSGAPEPPPEIREAMDALKHVPYALLFRRFFGALPERVDVPATLERFQEIALIANEVRRRAIIAGRDRADASILATAQSLLAEVDRLEQLAYTLRQAEAMRNASSSIHIPAGMARS